MNYKQYLKLGLPVIGLLTIIIVVALIVGRPRFEPEVSNSDQTVIDFNDLTVTKGDLYERMKNTYGLSAVIDMLDRALLEEYRDDVDEDAVIAKIEKEKENRGEDEFYDYLEERGIFIAPGETEEDLENKIYDFYVLTFLKEAAAREYARENLDENAVSDAVNDYVPDACVIPLTFSSVEAANAFLGEVAARQDELDYFIEEWDEPTSTEDEEETYLSGLLDCDYVRVRYDEVSGNYQDLVFNELEVGEYNDEATVVGSTNKQYYVVYKVAEAPEKSTYDQGKFEQELEDRLIDEIVDNTYINEHMTRLRKEADLEIHDPQIADQYEEAEESFEGYSKNKNKDLVASFNGGKITADDLYNKLKNRYSIETVIALVDFEALTKIEEISLSKEDKESFEERVTQMKTSFLASGYAQYFSWSEFMQLQYSVTSESELKDFLVRSELVRRYILGHEDYEGESPVSDEVIQDYQDEWVNAKASHILFNLDRNNDGDVTDEEKAEAYELALQVIEGAPEGADEDEDIFYEDEAFEGLNSIDINEYETVFSALAQEYSEDTGSGAQGGNIGWFGPLPIVNNEYLTQYQQAQRPSRMVEEFEEAVRNTPVGLFTDAPVLTEFGYHVILVTAKEEIPTKPADYDTYTQEDIQSFIEEGTNEEVVEYFEFIEQIKQQAETEIYTEDLINKELAELRDSLNFKFEDDFTELQAYYDILQENFLSYDTEEETTE